MAFLLNPEFEKGGRGVNLVIKVLGTVNRNVASTLKCKFEHQLYADLTISLSEHRGDEREGG